jgi:hypothetical protein
MNAQEHRQLIDEVGRLLNSQGLGVIHAHALQAAYGADFSAQSCARYLHAVANDLQARSRRTYDLAIGEARKYITAPNQRQVEDIVVRFDGADEQLAGQSEVSLGESADLTDLLSALREVAGAVRDDRSPL